jgi:hypothetical protein
MSSSNDWRSICIDRRRRHVGHCRVGSPMIAFIDRWLSRRTVTAPKPEPSFAFCGVSFNRADPAALDAEWTAEIMKRIASNTFFELKEFE